jgi:hypothetical protein
MAGLDPATCRRPMNTDDARQGTPSFILRLPCSGMAGTSPAMTVFLLWGRCLELWGAPRINSYRNIALCYLQHVWVALHSSHNQRECRCDNVDNMRKYRALGGTPCRRDEGRGLYTPHSPGPRRPQAGAFGGLLKEPAAGLPDRSKAERADSAGEKPAGTALSAMGALAPSTQSLPETHTPHPETPEPRAPRDDRTGRSAPSAARWSGAAAAAGSRPGRTAGRA